MSSYRRVDPPLPRNAESGIKPQLAEPLYLLSRSFPDMKPQAGNTKEDQIIYNFSSQDIHIPVEHILNTGRVDLQNHIKIILKLDKQ